MPGSWRPKGRLVFVTRELKHGTPAEWRGLNRRGAQRKSRKARLEAKRKHGIRVNSSEQHIGASKLAAVLHRGAAGHSFRIVKSAWHKLSLSVGWTRAASALGSCPQAAAADKRACRALVPKTEVKVASRIHPP